MKVVFIGSFERLIQCPKTEKPEFAFIGRSNVGKSSLLNMLLQNKNLARVSSTPGKTQHFNYFHIDDDWYLVDMPGYGYARRSATLRTQWQHEMNHYLLNRENLECVFLLIDINVPPKKNDLEQANWLGENGIPFIIVFTKTDRQTQVHNDNALAAYKEKMAENWETFPEFVFTSAEKATGRREILDIIKKVVKGS